MIIEKGKFYKTRSGIKVECLSTTLDTLLSCAFQTQNGLKGLLLTANSDGSFLASKEAHSLDIVAEWKEPHSRTLYINLFEESGHRFFVGTSHTDKQHAKEETSSTFPAAKIVGRGKITLTEGKFED
jgi:hypothetical protein